MNTIKRLFPLLVSSAIYGLIGVMMNTVLAVHMDRDNASTLQVGLLFSLSALAFLLFPPLWGAISDILERPKRVMLVTVFMSTLFFPLFIIFREPNQSIFLRFVFVACASGFLPPVMSQVSRIGGAEKRGSLLGMLNSSLGLGRGFGRIAAGFLLGFVTPDLSFIIMIFFGIAAFISLLFYEPDRKKSGRTFADLVEETINRLIPWKRGISHLKHNGLLWLFTAFSIRDMAILGCFAMLPVYLIKDAGLSEVQMGLMLSLNPFSQVLFQLYFGRLADTMGRKKLICFGLLGSAAVPVLLSFAGSPSLIFAGMVLVGFVYSSLSSGTTAFIGDSAPEERVSELMGLHLTFRGFGGFVGPLLVGILSSPDLLGFRNAFIFTGLLCVTAFFLTLFLTKESLIKTDGKI